MTAVSPSMVSGRVVATVRLPEAVGQRVADVPQEAVFLFLHHFQVGDGGVQHRVPVDQALAAVDQPLFVAGGDEGFGHHLI